MSAQYGIGVQNRYALFMGDEDNDPLDFVAKSKVEAVATQNTTAKKSGAKKTSTLNAAVSSEGKAATKDTVNGGLANASKTKQSQAATNKPAANAGNKPNRDSNASSAQHSNTVSGQSNAGKRGNEQRRVRDHDATKFANHKGENKQNRPPRQEKFSKPSTQNSSTNAFGTSPSQDNSWSQSGSGFGTSRDQKDIEERKNRRNLNSFEFNRDDSGRGRGGRGRGGQFRGRGRGRGANFDSRGKREYDRQSGSDKTGVKPMEKRDGSGAHNWGTMNDDFEAQYPVNDDTNEWNEKSGDENVFDTTVKEDGGAVDEEKKENEETNVEEEGPKEMTLSEWKKLEEEKRAKPSFNLRKPGEGEDNAQWKKTYVLKKKVEEEEDEYEEVEVEEEIRHGRQKRVLDIEINFKDENRDTRRGRGRGGGRGVGRGGRGGRDGREGGGRGEYRDRDGGRGEYRDRDGERPDKGRRGGGGYRARDSHEQSTPKVDDWNDFPSLAAA